MRAGDEGQERRQPDRAIWRGLLLQLPGGQQGEGADQAQGRLPVDVGVRCGIPLLQGAPHPCVKAAWVCVLLVAHGCTWAALFFLQSCTLCLWHPGNSMVNTMMTHRQRFMFLTLSWAFLGAADCTGPVVTGSHAVKMQEVARFFSLEVECR